MLLEILTLTILIMGAVVYLTYSQVRKLESQVVFAKQVALQTLTVTDVEEIVARKLKFRRMDGGSNTLGRNRNEIDFGEEQPQHQHDSEEETPGPGHDSEGQR